MAGHVTDPDTLSIGAAFEAEGSMKNAALHPSPGMASSPDYFAFFK